MLETFTRNIQTLGLNNVTLIKKTLQDCELSPDSFDLVVSIASLNHWDEQAFMNLYKDKAAGKIYLHQFRRILNSLTKGGQLLVFEAGRENLFSSVHNHWKIPNPMS